MIGMKNFVKVLEKMLMKLIIHLTIGCTVLHQNVIILDLFINRKPMFGTTDLLVLIVSFGAACFTLSLLKAARPAQ